jgi:DTW domain-containing protein YfiP
MHKNLCICSSIPSLNLKTRVVLIIHYKELKRTTNTGRLALHALKNSLVKVRGEEGEALDLSPLLEDRFESVLFYPSDDALELSHFVSTHSLKPLQLLVPDGNWRQASKVATRQPELRNIPRVKITKPNNGVDHLRKEHFAEGMSTLESIAAALSIIEGQNIGNQLHRLYQTKLQATLKGRGKIK